MDYILIAFIFLMGCFLLGIVVREMIRKPRPSRPNRTQYIVYDYAYVGELLWELERLDKLPRRKVKDGN